MRDNQQQALIGQKVTLVPYRSYHVPKYHQWMQNAVLREQTRSEMLTLDEEYEMQKSWAEDPQKCTFIVLKNIQNRSFLLMSTAELQDFCAAETECSSSTLAECTREQLKQQTEISCMIGDVNMFLQEQDSVDNDNDDCLKTAEIDVMIAENAVRRQGCGLEATVLMLLFGIKALNVGRFVAKISRQNSASLRMFTDKLKFSICAESDVFDEFTLELIVDEQHGCAALMSLLSCGYNAAVL